MQAIQGRGSHDSVIFRSPQGIGAGRGYAVGIMNAATPDASSPFVLDVGRVLREGQPERFERTGDAPLRLGAEMIGVEPGTEVHLEGYITPLGGGVLIDADVTAPLVGTCVRCLANLAEQLDVHVSAAFSAGHGFVVDEDGRDVDGEDGGATPLVGDLADLTQAIIDEAVLALPFNPTCAEIGVECDADTTGVPSPDGVSGEEGAPVDPRWAALADKFGDLGEEADDGVDDNDIDEGPVR